LDNTPQERTNLSIIALLAMCLEATYFTFRGEIYEQVFGRAMGSLVSVTVANVVMENVEERTQTTFLSPSKFW
jgi:hypothetical protein